MFSGFVYFASYYKNINMFTVIYEDYLRWSGKQP